MSEIVSINIAGWLACLAFTLMVLKHGSELLDRWRGKTPQPPNEQLAHGAEQLAERVKNLELKVEHHRELETQESYNRRQLIYQKIDTSKESTSKEIKELRSEVLSQISAMKSEIKADFESDIARIETKLDNFISREARA